MNYLGKFISNFKDFYNEINSATLTGAIDVVVIQQPDGTYLCSPFHVRFGKIGVLRSREKMVDIEINGNPIDIHMKLGESGEAFFVQEVEEEDDDIPVYLATSPLPSVPNIELELKKMKLENDLEEPCPSANDLKTSTRIETCEVSSKNGISEVKCEIKETTETVSVQTDKMSSECEMLLTTYVSNETNVTSQDDFKTKRKKRKKVVAKKRNKSREIDTPSVTSSEKRGKSGLDSSLYSDDDNDNDIEKTEDIFPMDDDYGEYEIDEGYPSGSLSRSISLPVPCNSLLSSEWTARKMSSTFTGEFHPFSDGDVTPQSSPTGSRPPSPKSDTEYENQKHDAMSQTDVGGPSWGWGELPNMPRRASDAQLSNRESAVLSGDVNEANRPEDRSEDEKRSMLSGMLNFMRSTKKMRHMPESEGIYLDDINTDDLDPEVAALYFPKFRSSYFPQGEIKTSVKDEDTESGNGPSLPHSPHSVEGAIGGPHSQDSDSDDRHYVFDFYHDIAMSSCGGLQDTEVDLPEDRFQNSLITYDEFTENPAVLQNPNLVVRVNGKYYNWLTAAPMLVSMAIFQRPLPEKTINRLVSEHMSKKKKSKSYSSWWSWRRSEVESKPEPESSPTATTTNASIVENSVNITTEIVSDHNNTLKTINSEITISDKNTSPVIHQQVVIEASKQIEVSETNVSNRTDLNCTIKETHMSGTLKETEVTFTAASSNSSSNCNSPIPVDEDSLRPNASDAQVLIDAKDTISVDTKKRPQKEKYKKSLRLTSEQIASLNLKDGPNEVVFSVTTAYQGTTRCKCHIYLWNYDDKIVISDIDGTITKSDVLGHLMPIIGNDWAQFGVAKLFTKVKANGYQFLYLSARAIGQARITRDYLRSVRQGEVCLPDGPLFLSPTSLISALHREVIERKPEEFKISCLKDIQTLFPACMGNPFYAGFGNKINDTWAYRAVGIPITRIYTINHRGELKLELIQTFQSSYTRLSDDVDHMFPPVNRCRKVNGQLAPSFTATEEFSYFTYWREPFESVSNDDLPE